MTDQTSDGQNNDGRNTGGQPEYGAYAPYSGDSQNNNVNGTAGSNDGSAQQQGSGGYYYAEYTQYTQYTPGNGGQSGPYNQQNPYNQNPYDQNSYGQSGQNPYQGPYDQNTYNQNPYNQNPYDQNPNGNAGPQQPGGWGPWRSRLADPFKLFEGMLPQRARKVIRLLYGVIGVAAVLLGIALLIWPGRTLVVAAFLLGIYLIISGVMRVVSAIVEPDLPTGWRVLDVIVGILLVIGGVIVIKNTTLSGTTVLFMITLVVGISWMAEGLMALLESWRVPKSGWAIVYAVVSLIAGLIILFSPLSSAVWLMVVGGIALIVMGIAALVRAFTFGRHSDNK